MCGIAGILLPPRADAERLGAIAAMTDTMTHRGPDDSGCWRDAAAGVALGHRRLAIVDLSPAGRQPMASASQRFVMSFNGEVYNFRELQATLAQDGCRFRGTSDTEVMLAAFERHGIEAALPMFAGMFALAAWDARARTLHLARDRLGKKPLHVALVDGALVFASELKAILAFPGFRKTIDLRAFDAVLRQGWTPDDMCIWEGVFKLPPGSVLSVRADALPGMTVEALKARARPWWSLADVARAGQSAPRPVDVLALEDELDALLRLVVRQRMISDVPLGAFLSGGIDSAAVVGAMQAQSTRPVRTFTISFTEDDYDEATDAARVARRYGTAHEEARLTPRDALALIPELPTVWDEPFADESQIPTLLLSRWVRQHVTVALTGDGGDENFAGYNRHRAIDRAPLLFSIPTPARRLAAGALRGRPSGVRGLVQRGVARCLSRESVERLARVADARDEADLYERLVTVNARSASLAPAGQPHFARAPQLPDRVARACYHDMANYLPGDILAKVDRASMAASLEVRSPFLDHRMVEFAWRLPSSVKLREGRGKWLLRRVLARYLPRDLFERPKHGFDVPVGAWLRGPLRPWAEALLDPARIRADGLMDAARVSALWSDLQSGRTGPAREIWPILMMRAWLETVRA